MKKIVVLLFAFVASVATTMAQGQHGVLKFAGKSSFSAATAHLTVESDTVLFQMTGQTADITIPSMTYQMGAAKKTIPSFVIHDVSYTMDMSTGTVTFSDQTFNETVMVDGVEKSIEVSSLSGAYKHDVFNTFTLTITFIYGGMPLPLTYTIEAYYIKTYTDRMEVTIDKQYTVEKVSYNIRTYPDGETTKLDVEVPTYDLPDATIGALTSGGYIVKGLAYDESRDGYYRDYSGDGLTLHFKTATIDNNYPLSAADANNILVTFVGKAIQIVNHYMPGAMPFLITTTFPIENGETSANTLRVNSQNDGFPVYNLSGQRVMNQTKGIVIIGGKKIVR